MLHVGILPQHFRWAEFLRRLRFVVIDDMHIYRGVFGSNVANILRRLRRVCALHGARPQFICASATIANPQEFTERLLGLNVTVIENGGAPQGPREVVLWNPPYLDEARLTRRSPYSEATWLFSTLVKRGGRTIAFTKARKVTELIYRYAATRLERRRRRPRSASVPTAPGICRRSGGGSSSGCSKAISWASCPRARWNWGSTSVAWMPPYWWVIRARSPAPGSASGGRGGAARRRWRCSLLWTTRSTST